MVHPISSLVMGLLTDQVGAWSDAGFLSRRMVHIESSRARDDLRAGYRSGSGPCLDRWSLILEFTVFLMKF